MPEFVKIIQHRGRDIVFVDCAGQEEAGVLRAFDEMLEAVFLLDEPARALVLFNMENTPTSVAINDKGREIIKRAVEKGIPELPTATAGFTGIQRMVARMFVSLRKGDTLYIASSIDDGKDWLVNRKG